MNEMPNSSSMQDVCSIYASPMHASFKYPSVGPSNVVTEQVNATQGFSQSLLKYLESWLEESSLLLLEV